MREQNEAALNLGMLAGTVDRVREMLARLAQPQRGAVAVALLPSITTVDEAVTRLVDDICRYAEEAEELKIKN